MGGTYFKEVIASFPPYPGAVALAIAPLFLLKTGYSIDKFVNYCILKNLHLPKPLTMYKLPSAGPSFLLHLAIVLAAALTFPIMKLTRLARRKNA